MTDTTTTTTAEAAPAKAPRAAIALRDWIDSAGKPVAAGKEGDATGFSYTHLPTAKRSKADFNPETDSPPADSVFTFDCTNPANAHAVTMLAIFGGLTLAGNVVNSATNGTKGDPNINPIPLIAARFDEIVAGQWADREGGGGIRYDKEKLAQAIAMAKGETDPTPYIAKMAIKLNPTTGAPVPDDTKGAITYGAFALRNAEVKAAYDKLTGGGTKLEAL